MGADVRQITPIVKSRGIVLALIGPTWFHTVQGGDRATIFNPLFELGFGAGAGGLGTGNFLNSRRDSYLTLDMRAGLQGENWSLMAFAQNLTDETFLKKLFPLPNLAAVSWRLVHNED